MFLRKANRLEELKNVHRLFPFSCPTPTAAAVEQVQWAVVRCCKCFLWMIFWAPVFFLRIFYFDLRCKHLLVCHPNSSQNEWCGWLQLPDSIQFAQNPFPLDFHPKQLVCKYPKPYFHVIRLFPWITKVYNDNPPYIRTYICGSFSTLRASQIFLRVPNAGVAGHVSLPAAIGATDE